MKSFTYDDIIAYWNADKISSVSDLQRKMSSYRILFAYNSNRIENQLTTYHDTREIFENGKVINYTGDLRTIFEIQNQKQCYEYLLPLIAEKKPLDIGLVKEVHKILTNGTYDDIRFSEKGERPGEFKKHDYVTGRNEVGTPPEYVEGDLKSMLDDVASAVEHKNYDPLKVAAYFHASFEFIHPFADGNGRVGRTLLNYYLMINDHPPLIVYDEDKNAYYDALELFDETESLSELVEFLKHETVKTWEKQFTRDNSFFIDALNKTLTEFEDKGMSGTVENIPWRISSEGDFQFQLSFNGEPFLECLQDQLETINDGSIDRNLVSAAIREVKDNYPFIKTEQRRY